MKEYRLKTKDESCFWTEIVRRMSTQKAVTTEGTNVLGEKVQMRLCSEPSKMAEDIYGKLGYKKMRFIKIRLCSTQKSQKIVVPLPHAFHIRDKTQLKSPM